MNGNDVVKYISQSYTILPVKCGTRVDPDLSAIPSPQKAKVTRAQTHFQQQNLKKKGSLTIFVKTLTIFASFQTSWEMT